MGREVCAVRETWGQWGRGSRLENHNAWYRRAERHLHGFQTALQSSRGSETSKARGGGEVYVLALCILPSWTPPQYGLHMENAC